MKVLRFILLIAGLVLVGWGVSDYFSNIPETAKQAIPKMILGVIGFVAALLSKSRR